MRVAVCDDDELCRRLTGEMLKLYVTSCPEKEVSFEMFDSANKLLNDICRNGGYDVYLLDILMPGMDGMELGAKIRELSPSSMIIYLTSSPQYALESYKVKAFNYILKPVEKNVLFKSLDESFDSFFSKKVKCLIVKTKTGSVRVDFDSIVYVEICNRAMVLHLTNGRIVESVKLRLPFAEAVQELFRDERFIACGASVVANMHYICRIDSDVIFFKDGDMVSLPRKSFREVQQRWQLFWLNKDQDDE